MVTKAKKRERRAQRHAAAANRIATRRTKEKEQAQSQTALLSDERELKKDLPLIAEAVKQQWPVPVGEKAKVLVDRLVGIAEKKVVMVPCGEGIAPSEAIADANSIKAIALLQSMSKQNHAEAQKQNAAPAVGAQTTINVGVQVDAAGSDDRRSRVAAIAQRYGAGEVLFIDKPGQSAGNHQRSIGTDSGNQ